MDMLSNSKFPNSTVMYPVKPIFDHNIKIELPDVMYKVKSLHMESQTFQKDSSPLDPVAALEKRQESILARLAELRQTLDKLTSQYSTADAKQTSSLQSTALPCKTPSVKKNSPLGSSIHDIVVSADPEKPPLSVFILYELMKKQFKVLGTSYLHSSVISMDQRLKEAVRAGSQVTRGNHQLALSLIWKKGNDKWLIYGNANKWVSFQVGELPSTCHTEIGPLVDNGPCLMISPTKQAAVTGEVNVARYINRVINPDCEADIVIATQIDEWLDIAHIQILNGNLKEKAAALRNLNSRLGRNDWLVGSSLSMADIVTWSALQQTNQASGAPANVKKWLKMCNENELFRTAMSFL